MKQTNVQFDYDAEKLEAIRLFLAQKNSTLDDTLVDFMEQLYKKHVPATVREYIELRNIADNSKQPKKGVTP